MTWNPFRSRAFWIVPIVLLVVALFEDVLTYKVRQHVSDVRLRALVVLLLNAFAFGIAAGWLAPRLQRLLTTARRHSTRAGTIGLWTFYALAYGALYYAFLVVERSGTGTLLPAALR